MLASAVVKLCGANYDPEHISTLLLSMQAGGDPAMRAHLSLTLTARELSAADRLKLARLLEEYRQAIGRWFIAESHGRLAREPLPPVIRG